MRYTIIICLALVALLGCENDAYLYQDVDRIWISGDSEQNATVDSVYYSFRLYDFSTTEADLNVVVHLTGHASDRARQFHLEVVDTLTNVPTDAYSIGETMLPAGAFTVTVPVRVKRHITGIDLTKTNARLALRVRPSDELQTGVEESISYKLVWCDFLLQPTTWSVISYYIGPFSQARYKFIIDFTGMTDFADLNGDYNRIIGLQGLLNRLLKDYNSNPANAGRPEGWPYQNDNGDPLAFGQGLAY
ncbi:MAG: DUF4843 domain-containing protein [Dysgonamonadaceae bacterium]|jgi:hypothetical protein|nr:DUF4843 domain-containing protein [Dysgonamonadaceae bacterium]